MAQGRKPLWYIYTYILQFYIIINKSVSKDKCEHDLARFKLESGYSKYASTYDFLFYRAVSLNLHKLCGYIIAGFKCL